MLLSTLRASLLGNIIAEKVARGRERSETLAMWDYIPWWEVIQAGKGKIKARQDV